MNRLDVDYPCVGVCMTDPETGYCIGCGRPPAPAPVDTLVPVAETRVDSDSGRSDAQASADSLSARRASRC